MYALFRAGQAELLEWQPGWAQLPLLPLVWSLSRARLVEGTDLASRLARIWLRWNPNHRACSRHTPDACLRGLLEAPSWEARLTWLLLLLEGYRDRAADPLLPWLRHRDEEVRQIAALGLAQLGRQIIPDLKVFRRRPPDPDPENRLRILEHLQCKVGLTESEWAQLEELSQITATSYGARVLLEGRGVEPRNRPDA